MNSYVIKAMVWFFKEEKPTFVSKVYKAEKVEQAIDQFYNEYKPQGNYDIREVEKI